MLGLLHWTRFVRPPRPLEPVQLKLRGRERRELNRIIRAATAEQRLVLRARIVLLAADGLNNSEIAEELLCDVKTVRKWRWRFHVYRMEGLDDLVRPGRPVVFEASQRQEVFTLATSAPPHPLGRWTVDLLAEHLVESGIVPAISRETVSLWLRTADLKPHRVKYWLNSKDPDFRTKRDRVLALYLSPPRDGVVICVDEKTSIQALERCHPEKPAGFRWPRHVEFEYKRHGTVHLIAAFEVHTGRVPAYQCVKPNNSKAFIAFCRKLLKLYPRRKLYLVLDYCCSASMASNRSFDVAS